MGTISKDSFDKMVFTNCAGLFLFIQYVVFVIMLGGFTFGGTKLSDQTRRVHPLIYELVLRVGVQHNNIV